MTDPPDPRERLLAYVATHPGAHLRELGRAVPLSFGALRHHLDRLEKEGRLRVEFDRRFKRYFPAGLDAPTRQMMTALRQRPLRRILVSLAADPGQRHADLGRRLSIPASSLTAYLQRLKALGLVVVLPGAPKTYAAVDPEQVRQGLRSLRPTVTDRLVDAVTEVFQDLER